MNYKYSNIKKVIKMEPFYQRNIKQAIGKFPAIDCPDEYKEGLCAISDGRDLNEFLNEKYEALGNRSIMEVLQARDYAAIEQYIYECVSLDISGPGAL